MSTDDPTPGQDLSDTEAAALDELLSARSLWVDAEPGDEDAIVAAIAAEAAGHRPPTSAMSARRTAGQGRRAAVGLRIVAAAAAIALVLAASAIVLTGREPSGVEVALAGTDLAPDARGVALVDDGPLGVRIVLDVSDLPPAPDGTYYQAWVRQSPEVGVGAGTFHLRGGDGTIELWAGVSTDDYPLITVTLQDEGGGAASSGRVVLRGRVDDS